MPGSRIVAAHVATFATDDGRAFPTRYGLGMAVRPRVYVKLTDDQGTIGYGEASPLSHFTGETVGIIAAALETLLPRVIGCDPRAVGDLADRLAHSPNNFAAKCAIDIAAHDLAAKSLGISLSIFLGGATGRTVHGTGLIGIVTHEEAATQARDYLADGITTLKLKVGRDPVDDIGRVAAVRSAVGPTVALRLDGNAGLPLPAALTIVNGLSREGIALELFEQPVRADDLRGLHAIRETGTRVLVDESVHDLRDAVRILEAGACDLIAIKLIKCGGLRAAATIAQVAATYGVGCVLISPYETAVGMAATAHAAAVFGTRDHAHDILRYPTESAGQWTHHVIPGGLHLDGTPGHGAQLSLAIDALLTSHLELARSAPGGANNATR